MPISEDDFLSRLGNRLTTLRIRGRRSQRDLAAKSGVDVSTISRIENGKQDPSSTSLARIAAELGITVAAFWSDEEGPSRLPSVHSSAHQESLEAQVAELQGMIADLNDRVAPVLENMPALLTLLRQRGKQAPPG